jgi:hypothetical protein
MTTNTLPETQSRILQVFYDLQHSEDTGFFNDDETPLVSYKRLEKDLSTTRDRLKPDVIELRNSGYIELVPAVDMDYIPSGSGWVLTDKGQDLVKGLFFKEPA